MLRTIFLAVLFASSGILEPSFVPAGALAQEPGDPAGTPARADSVTAPPRVSEPAATVADPSEGALASTTATDDYGIVPGDRIRLMIWREPELSGTYHVDERGEIVLPKLGSLAMAGLGPAEARERIQKRYSTYLRNPAVEVTVLRRIGVHGEVKAPTLYWLDVTMSVRDAIAVAGGILPTGDPEEISLVRAGGTVELEGGETAALVESGLRSGDQIVVGRRSWVAINAPYVISSGISLLSILSGFLLAR